jgi:hypothetical protein
MVDKPDTASPDRLTTTSADSSDTPLRGMRGRDLGLLPTSAALSMSLSLTYPFWRMRYVLVAQQADLVAWLVLLFSTFADYNSAS